MIRAMEIASIPAHGPSTTAASPMPAACPVVPPGSGRLNIMITNEKAANRDSRGTRRVCIARLTFCNETYQNGVEPA